MTNPCYINLMPSIVIDNRNNKVKLQICTAWSTLSSKLNAQFLLKVGQGVINRVMGGEGSPKHKVTKRGLKRILRHN